MGAASYLEYHGIGAYVTTADVLTGCLLRPYTTSSVVGPAGCLDMQSLTYYRRYVNRTIYPKFSIVNPRYDGQGRNIGGELIHPQWLHTRK